MTTAFLVVLYKTLLGGFHCICLDLLTGERKK
jgi:hypothetical protein